MKSSGDNNEVISIQDISPLIASLQKIKALNQSAKNRMAEELAAETCLPITAVRRMLHLEHSDSSSHTH